MNSTRFKILFTGAIALGILAAVLLSLSTPTPSPEAKAILNLLKNPDWKVTPDGTCIDHDALNITIDSNGKIWTVSDGLWLQVKVFSRSDEAQFFKCGQDLRKKLYVEQLNKRLNPAQISITKIIR